MDISNQPKANRGRLWVIMVSPPSWALGGAWMDGAILSPLRGPTDPSIDRNSLPPVKGEPDFDLLHPKGA